MLSNPGIERAADSDMVSNQMHPSHVDQREAAPKINKMVPPALHRAINRLAGLNLTFRNMKNAQGDSIPRDKKVT